MVSLPSRGVFGQAEYDFNNLTAFVAGSLNNTTQWRKDRFYYDAAHAESDKVSKIGFTVKGGVNYKFPHFDAWGGQHNVFGNIGYISRAPFFSGGVFLASQVSNQVNPDAVNEKIFSGELGYSYHTAAFTANVNVYHTEWKDKTMAKMTEIPVDGNVERTWINMQGVNSIHEGVEVDLSYKPAKWFSLRGMLSVGNWRWTNDPVGYFYNSAGQPIDSSDIRSNRAKVPTTPACVSTRRT